MLLRQRVKPANQKQKPQFEIWLSKWQNALSIGSGIQAYKK